YSHRQESTEFLRVNPGLTILSRHRIVETAFRPFKECADTDCLAQKGVLFTRLDVAGFGPVDVYDTHYQAHGPYTKERLHDNSVLQAMFKEQDAGHPAFLLGDFNFPEGGTEYADLMNRLGPRDLYRAHRPTEKGGTSKSGSRIDYVFCVPARDYDVTVLDSAVMFEGTGLSDHNGVRVDVRITARR
ncbi:MAG: endonuclease/exonuclease/phosphatase family protein, partial [Candidatus Sericytochromatia bacterium]|nr:endonuclease/exonuclease/phosphatase family protein [Candidatus Tanganyikabacteria bacterium]